jgi:hypothetical protein
MSNAAQTKTFETINKTPRNSECENVCVCRGERNPDPKKWVETANEQAHAGMTMLWRAGSFEFYGWM